MVLLWKNLQDISREGKVEKNVHSVLHLTYQGKNTELYNKGFKMWENLTKLGDIPTNYKVSTLLR